MARTWTRRKLLCAAGPAGAWVALGGCEPRPTTDSPDQLPEPGANEHLSTQLGQPLPDLRLDVPHLTGHRGYEAEACVAMVARHAGLEARPDEIFDDSGLSPILGRGCSEPQELRVAMRRLGFAPDELTEQTWEQLLATIVEDLQAGLPTILEVTPFANEPGASQRPRGPWVVVIGCTGNNLRFHDPASSDGADRRQPAAHLLAAKHSGLRTLHPNPLQIQRSDRAHRPFDFSRRIRQLRAELDRHGLHVAMEEPFVVVGDAAPDKLASYSQQIVRWAVDLLRKAYFRRDPQELVEIWLLSTDDSYRHWATTRWGDPPTTPYGYYDPAAEVIVMNISTGGGTLVHELVHPFIATNFPRCPKWFDEGLASLYEQSSERDGKLMGLPNWRLAGLHEALRQNTLPSFKTLCESGRRFYADDPGTNYAQARYLCYWLQEAGLLNRFYHAFVASVGEDPTGYKTLQKIIRTTDMVGFQRRWSKAMLQLQYP